MDDPSDGTQEPDAPQVEGQKGAEAPVVEETPERYQPLTFEEAMARAKGEAPTQEEPDAQDGTSASAAPPEGEQAAAPPAAEPAAAEKASNVEAELDRIYTYIREGRVHELPANLRGRAQAIQRDVVAAHTREQAEEVEFRKLYLQLEAHRVENPDEFKRLLYDPRDPLAVQRRGFYEAYSLEHPEVSLDDPDAVATVIPERIREETSRELFNDLNEAVNAIASEAGIPANRVTELRAQAQGPWSFLESAFTEAVKAAGEKERAKIREEERHAAALEAQAKYVGKTVVTPRVLGGPAGKPTRDPSKPITWEQAAAEARELLASS